MVDVFTKLGQNPCVFNHFVRKRGTVDSKSRSGAPFWASWALLGSSWGSLGPSYVLSWRLLGLSGLSWGPLGVLLGSLGLVLKLSWRLLGLRKGPKKPQQSQKRASRGPFLGTLILRRNCSESLHELFTKLLFGFSGIWATSQKSIEKY